MTHGCTFKQHYASKDAMLRAVTRDLKLTGAVCTIQWDKERGMWLATSSHRRGCGCGDCAAEVKR